MTTTPVRRDPDLTAAKPKPGPPRGFSRSRSGISGTAYHLFSGILAAVFLMPLIWVALNSIKT